MSVAQKISHKNLSQFVACILNLGKILCYADDSYLISWDKFSQIASRETTDVVDWLQDIGMVVNSLKTEAIYFSKHEEVGLEIEVASSKIQVRTTMKVLGVMFDSKLSWESHIANALRQISSDLGQSELLSIAHG